MLGKFAIFSMVLFFFISCQESNGKKNSDYPLPEEDYDNLSDNDCNDDNDSRNDGIITDIYDAETFLKDEDFRDTESLSDELPDSDEAFSYEHSEVWENDVPDVDKAEINQRVEKILADMSLEERCAQMHGISETLVDDFYQTASNKRLGIPGFKIPDGGPRGVRIGINEGKAATVFPVGMARGASWNPFLEEKVGEAIAVEARAFGGQMILGPMITVLRHPGWGRAQETYGEDTKHIGIMGSSYISGAQKHVMAVAKAFAMNSVDNLRWGIDVVADERTLREVYLPHYKMAVQAGTAGIMSAYNSVNGDWMGENNHLLRDILKEEWGFDGFVISDWGFGCRDTKGCGEGGLDIEMPQSKFFGRPMVRMIEEGFLDKSIPEEAARRIIRKKIEFGLMDNWEKYDESLISSPQHLEIALKAAEESIVLLKNNSKILPLNREKTKKIALVGKLAFEGNLGDHGSSYVTPTSVVTPYAGIVEAGQGVEILPFSDNILDSSQLKMVAESDVAVVVAGLTWEDEGEFVFDYGGDRFELGLSSEHVEMINQIVKIQPNTIVILEGGSAITMSEWIDKVPALLMAWYPGQMGGKAIGEILFGDINPSAKLPLTIPETDLQLPEFTISKRHLEYGFFHGYRLFQHENITPQFPFGFGLSYTDFEIKNLEIIEEIDKIKVSVNVTNLGKKEGAEVVQIYIGVPDSEIERAPIELKGFNKVFLKPKETKIVDILLSYEDFAYYSELAESFEIEDASYKIYAGNSSLNLLLSKEITLPEKFLKWREKTTGKGTSSHNSFGSDLLCGGVSCPPTKMGTPLCCTPQGTGEKGNPYEYLGTSPNRCGTDIALFKPELKGICIEVNQPGNDSDECQEVVDLNQKMEGCCSIHGICGVMDKRLGLGCVPLLGNKKVCSKK